MWTGRVVRHEPVLLASDGPTSSVIANGLSMRAVFFHEPELRDIAVGNRLDPGEARIVLFSEEMREALLKPQILDHRQLAPDRGPSGDLAIFGFEQRKESRLDGKPGNLDRVCRQRPPAQRTRDVDVNVACSVEAHRSGNLALEIAQVGDAG